MVVIYLAGVEEGFALNYKNKYEIDINPDGNTPNWAVIAKGISNVDPSFEDETDYTYHYEDEGFGNETVVGIKASLSFTGHRVFGDVAQDYISGLTFELGEKRETKLRWTQADKVTIIANVTVSNIKTSGGDANSKQDFEFTTTFNGKPIITEPENIPEEPNIPSNVDGGTFLSTPTEIIDGGNFTNTPTEIMDGGGF